MNISSPVQADEIYGFVDGDGVSHFSNVPDSSRYRLVLRNPDACCLRNPGQSAAFALQQSYGPAILREAQSNGIDPYLVAAIIAVESNHNPMARSSKGAIGLMQVLPETALRYGIGNIAVPDNNIRAGVSYLHDLLAMFDGNLSLVLAAYNAGENAVIRHGNRIPPYPETRNYVPRVLKKYKELRGVGLDKTDTLAPPIPSHKIFPKLST